MAREGNTQQGSNSHEHDKEFAILSGAAKNIDFVAASERAQAKTAERLMSLTIEEAEGNQERLDLAAVERRIKELFDEKERRNLALLQVIDEHGEERAKQILKDIEELRKFFFAISHGWKQARRIYGRWYVDKLMKEIRQSCPEEVALYKKARREWRECRRRYLATETEREWQWYRAGKGNQNSVAYRTKVDLSRQGGEAHFRNRRLMKYMAHELLTREGERTRAKKELRAAQAAMTRARQRSYQKIGIPLDLIG